jgi:hypothetical protein
MFNNGLTDSSLFHCISLLRLPHCLPAHISCVVCSFSFYALCTMSIHCIVPLLFNLASALSSFMHELPSITTTTTTSSNNNNHNHFQQQQQPQPLPATTTTTATSRNNRSHNHFQQQQQLHLFSVWCIYSFCASCACNVHNLSSYSHRVVILHNSSALSDHHRDSLASLAIETLHILCDSRAHSFHFSYELQPSSTCQFSPQIIFIPLAYSM